MHGSPLRWIVKCLSLVLCLALLAPGFSGAQEDKTSSSSDWIYAALGIGGLIYLLTHHHPHTVSPSPTPSPPVTPTIPPTVEATPSIVTPTPTASPTPPPCTYRLTDGWFAPTQGPDQDDTTFVERPAVFTRTDSTPNHIVYYAPLYMIEDRPTVLEGVDHYRSDGQIVRVNSRDDIVFKGETNCTKPISVALNFTLLEHGARKMIYASNVLADIPLSGKARKHFVPFTVVLRAPRGIPSSSEFTISKADPDYAIVGEIVKHSNGAGTGMRVIVEGIETPTVGPQIVIVPVMLSPTGAEGGSGTSISMSSLARILQRDLYENVPDVYPLRPHGLPLPEIAPVLNLEGQVLVTIDLTRRQKDNMIAAVGDRLATMGSLAGAGRIVVMLRHQDFADFEGASNVVGVSLNDKVVVVSEAVQVGDVAGNVHAAWVIAAHEIAHTLPHFLWSADQMAPECGLDYHNKYGVFAHGLQTMYVSMPGMHRRINTLGLLQGYYGGSTTWITQCTYHNLIYALMQQVDPPLMLVRGFIARTTNSEVARFAPSYDLMGSADLRSPGRGVYALVVHPPNAKATAYHFTPSFRTENGGQRAIISFGYHIPPPAAGSRIDLVGPHGTLASFTRSVDAPALTIAAPDLANGNTVRVHWAASSPGHTLLSSVLVSQNSALFWPQIFERRISSATIPIGAYTTRLRIKVIVTDGSRSTDQTVTVNILPHSSGGRI